MTYCIYDMEKLGTAVKKENMTVEEGLNGSHRWKWPYIYSNKCPQWQDNDVMLVTEFIYWIRTWVMLESRLVKPETWSGVYWAGLK